MGEATTHDGARARGEKEKLTSVVAAIKVEGGDVGVVAEVLELVSEGGSLAQGLLSRLLVLLGVHETRHVVLLVLGSLPLLLVVLGARGTVINLLWRRAKLCWAHAVQGLASGA